MKRDRSLKIELMVLQILIIISLAAINPLCLTGAVASGENLTCDYVNREVVLDAWGNIYFYDSYRIQNTGSVKMGDVTLRIPIDVEEISTYDAGGALTFAEINLNDTREIKVSLRYPLRGNETKTFYDIAAFTIRYTRESHDLISVDSWTHYQLTLNLSMGLNVTIQNLDVHIVLPEGSRFQTSSHASNASLQGLTPVIDYTFNDINSTSAPRLTVDYEYLVYWSALRPSLFVGIGVAIVGTLSIVQRRRKKQEPPIILSDKQSRLIQTFTESCDEQILLWSDLDSLEESFDDKEIGRKDYNRRKGIILQRLRILSSTLSNLKNELRSIKFSDMELVNKLDQAETEILMLRDTIERSRMQYRSGRLPKRTYIELKDGYERKVEESKKTIEQLIIELKSEDS